jgi:hypothetical protein
MVSRIFFWRAVSPLGVLWGCLPRWVALPSAAGAAMFANAFPLPGLSGRYAGNVRPELSDPADQLQKWLFLVPNVGQPQGFFKHLF